MVMDMITAIIPTIIDYTVRPLGRQVSYIIFYKSKLKHLSSTLKNFDAVEVRMKHAVEEVEGTVNQKVEDDVRNWQTKADEISREAEALLGDEGRAKTKCLYICPNLISYHQLGRKSTKLVRKIEEHENKKEFASVSYNVAVEDISAIASDDYMAFESRTSMVKDIIAELKKPDINKIGVYGLGGIGKTTLAKEVYREAMEEKLFDDVVIILNVKEKKHDETIQKAITKKLRMDDNSEDIGTRANVLRARIKEGKTLVILDDVLDAIDFEVMGLIGVPNCKLLMTSRERQVLFNDMRTQKNFELGFLKENESWSLFEKMAGEVVKDNSILKEATQLAKKCGGLPVLIVTVASALRESSLEEWKDALRSFKRFDKKEMNVKAFLALKWSYEQLEDQELKQLFLLCGSCSKFLSDLLKYSMGLGLIKNVETVEEARNSLNRMVKKLKNSCLLLDSYDDETVMHELVRDFAVRIASDDQKAFSRAYGDEVKQWPTEDVLKKCTRMSLRGCKIPRLPDVPWECPELKLLMLSDNNTDDSLEIPGKFFEGMKELEVLDVSGIRIPSLPPSLLSLKHLHTLCLNRCEFVDITLVGELTNLKILSLLQSNIKELPREIGQLTRLQLLDLTGCSELVLISPDVISSLTRLEDLRMGIKSFKQWEGKGLVDGRRNASVSELKHLSHISALDVHIPDANLLPTNLFSDKLERYTILVGDCWEYPNIHATSSNMLKLKLTRSNQFDRGIKLLVKRCEQLYLDGVEIVNIISYLFDSEAVNQLKHLHVQNNDEVKYVINSVNWSYSHNAFSNLESLALENLVSLESVCYGQLIGESFRKLKSLTLRNLPKLIGFSSKGKQLTNDTNADEILLEDEAEEVLMPNLTTLTVDQCDSLRFVFSSSMAKCLEQLKHLKISKCQALQMVYDTSSTTQLNGFKCPNLNLVEIDSCDSLKNVFPASVAKDLKQLSKLMVENCSLMEEIVAKEEGPRTAYEEFGFPKVTFMEFDNLPQLGSFYPGPHVSNWPSLNFLKFTKCGGVEIFVTEFSTYQKKLELGHPSSTKQPFFLIDKGKSFLNLEYLILDENTEIWYEPYGPLPAEMLRKLKGIFFATSHPKSDVFFENLQNTELLRVLSAPWKELNEVETLPCVKVLCLEKCGRLENLTSSLTSFRNLTTLYIQSCHRLQYLIPYSVGKNLQQLKHLKISKCQALQMVYDTSSTTQLNDFKCPNLNSVEIDSCDSLKNVFPASVAIDLKHLSKLKVENCSLMEEIVAKEDGPQTAYKEFGFPKVTFMEFDNLPQLGNFYPGLHVSNWPSLNFLKYTKCGVEIFVAEFSTYQKKLELGHPSPTKQPFFLIEKGKSFLNLDYLILDENTEIWYEPYGPLPAEMLRKLKGIFFATSHPKSDVFFENLQNTELLRVLSAPWKELNEVETLPCVKVLCLEKCGRLENLTSSLTSLRNLTTLYIQSCHGLQYLIPYSVGKNLQQLQVLDVGYCERMVEIVASNVDDSENAITFGCLQHLKLSNLPSLQGFCTGNCVFKVPSLLSKNLIVEDCQLIELKISPDGLLQSDPRPERLQIAEETDDVPMLSDSEESDPNQTEQLMIANLNVDVTIPRLSAKKESSPSAWRVKVFQLCAIACLCVIFLFLLFFLLKEEISVWRADWTAL